MKSADMTSHSPFYKQSMGARAVKHWLFVLLIYTLTVILWGAWVRISHSGDGCGESWPLCQGQLIPELAQKKTWVEYGHRLMSGLYGILVIGFAVRLGQNRQIPWSLRRSIGWVLFFTITESLLGAKLVLSGLVMGNSSWVRLVTMGLHQVNSFMLTGMVAWTYFLAQRTEEWSTDDCQSGDAFDGKSSIFKILRGVPFMWGGVLVIAVTGTWAALAGVVFPAHNLTEELQRDFATQAHYLIRLRIFHPLMASVVGGSIALFAWNRIQSVENPFVSEESRALVRLMVILIVALLFGYITLFSLSPTWMKLSHLLMAHGVWIFVLNYLYCRRLSKPSDDSGR